ncbi:MAG: hypothetical protein R3C10_20115 [Pirellulales bacterium]
MATAERSLAWVAVAVIVVVAAVRLFRPTPASATPGLGFASLLAGLSYAGLTAATLAERSGRLRRRQATVAAEWTIHLVAQFIALVTVAFIFARGSAAETIALGLEMLLAGITTVALLALILDLAGRLTTMPDVYDRDMFRVMWRGVATPARGIVLAGATLLAAVVLSATLLYLECVG